MRSENLPAEPLTVSHLITGHSFLRGKYIRCSAITVRVVSGNATWKIPHVLILRRTAYDFNRTHSGYTNSVSLCFKWYKTPVMVNSGPVTRVSHSGVYKLIHTGTWTRSQGRHPQGSQDMKEGVVLFFASSLLHVCFHFWVGHSNLLSTSLSWEAFKLWSSAELLWLATENPQEAQILLERGT